MILHDFIYEWDGKTSDGKAPISWWPGSYHVRIIKLGNDGDNVSYLTPHAVILKNAKLNSDMNTSLKNYIHTFAKKISKQYHLDIEKTMWVEIRDEIFVTRIKPGPDVVIRAIQFDIEWRSIRPNELEMLQPYLEEM